MSLRDEILAGGFDLQRRDDTAIAAALSIGRTKIVPTPIGIGTVLSVMAPFGGEFLNTLETIGASDANVKWALRMIEQASFDVGHPVTRAQLEAFAGAVPAMAGAVNALLNVAVIPDLVSVGEVSDTLNAEGY